MVKEDVPPKTVPLAAFSLPSLGSQRRFCFPDNAWNVLPHCGVDKYLFFPISGISTSSLYYREDSLYRHIRIDRGYEADVDTYKLASRQRAGDYNNHISGKKKREKEGQPLYTGKG